MFYLDFLATAQNRVINAPPQVKDALKQFYPDINNSDILAYTLDPEKGLADIAVWIVIRILRKKI